MYGKNSVSPLSAQQLGSHVISAGPSVSGPRGLFNITSTPLTTVHQIASSGDLLGMPVPADEPRTKSERSTKVYIGKIPSGLSDYFMEQLFLECGHINSWRRVLDSSGKPLNFGFVEFTFVEGMLRCLRLMNNLQIQSSKLVCRVDTQTEFFIKEWSDLKRADWERKKWDNIMNKSDTELKTWEEDVVKDDPRVAGNVQSLISNFEQHAGDDPDVKEDDK
jgi:RNA recognition motif-containing protein